MCPKFEIRSTKSETNPKPKTTTPRHEEACLDCVAGFEFVRFEFVSDFVLRVLGTPIPIVTLARALGAATTCLTSIAAGGIAEP